MIKLCDCVGCGLRRRIHSTACEGEGGGGCWQCPIHHEASSLASLVCVARLGSAKKKQV